MTLDKLQSCYNSWPKYSVEEKIDLLAKTEKKIQNATSDKVADFCLYVLSKISLEHECNQYPALNDSVRKLTLTVQSKSSSIYFFNLNLIASEHVAFIINGKNPYLAIGEAPIQASTAIAEARWEFTGFGKSSIPLDSGISQGTCMTLLILFNQTQKEQEYALQKTFGQEIEDIKYAAKCFKVRGPLQEAIDRQFTICNRKKKNSLFLEKLGNCKDEDTLIDLFYQLHNYKEFPEAERIILRLIQIHYSKQRETPLCEDALDMLHWYLLKTRNEAFEYPFSFTIERSFCFAHYMIVKEAFSNDPINEILGIKRTYLHWLIHKELDGYLPIVKQSLSIYTKTEVQNILDVIGSILSLKPDDFDLRKGLIEIIRAVPFQQRERFTSDLLSYDYFISSIDPLFQMYLEELERTGSGWNVALRLLSYDTTENAIRFLNKLASAYPEQALEYAIEVTYSSTLYNLKFDIRSVVTVLDEFFEKIQHMPEANGFLFRICDHIVKVNAFYIATHVVEWEKKICKSSSVIITSPTCSLLMAYGKATPLLIADCIIGQEKLLTDSGFDQVLFKLLSTSDCLKLYSKEDEDLFKKDMQLDAQQQNKIKEVEFLTRMHRLFRVSQNMSLLNRCLLSLIFHLWMDKNYAKAFDLLCSLENMGIDSILFPLLEKISSIEKEENYQKLVALVIQIGPEGKVLEYLKKSKMFTEFHIDLMNHRKALSILSKKTF